MAENKKNNNSENIQKQVPNNVIQITAFKCQAEDCKSKPTRAGFCDHHYMWFKEGLITTEGYKAKDFEKKYQQFIARNKAA